MALGEGCIAWRFEEMLGREDGMEIRGQDRSLVLWQGGGHGAFG